MEKIEFENQLLEAIKKDDLKSFTFLMSNDSELNICFGRFPLLSLLYLYSSYKILSKFEKKLLQIHNFRIVDERIDLYQKFKNHARKSLRLFNGEEIIYPILMLAVLDERIIIENKFDFLYKNVEIIEKFNIIYRLNHKTHVDADVDYLIIPSRKLTKGNYFILGMIALVLSFVVAFSTMLIIVISNKNGLGTAKTPLKLSTAEEFYMALAGGDRYYVFKNDIAVTSNDAVNESFSGVMDGAGYTLTIDGEVNSAMLKNLTGTIKNLNIKLNNNQIKIAQNSAIISENNSGKIENCAILGNFTQEYKASDEVFVGLFTSQNSGLISNCKTLASGVISNFNETNAFFGLFAGQNLESGKIENCVTENGIIIADTVDVAGMVGYNLGEIRLCENKAKISQTSEKQWNPNVAGIVVANYGKIESCKNSAELSSKSTLSDLPENPLYVFVAGIACENYGDILYCLNQGTVIGYGDEINIVASGITANNIKNSDYEAVVKYSNSNSNITASSNAGQVCVGGIAGINSSVILYSGSQGVIDAVSNANTNTAVFMNEVDKPVAIVSGGIVGVNQSAVVQNCYADVDFVNVSDAGDVVKIYSGAIGSVGMFKFRVWAEVGGEDVYSIDYAGDSLDYIYNNFYVNKESIKQCAYGIYGTLEQKLGGLYYKSGVVESLDSEVYSARMKKCASFDEIPEGVRANA